MTDTILICERAKRAAKELSQLSVARVNAALEKMAAALTDHTDDILAANGEDVKDARSKLSEVMIDRLVLTKERIEAMAKGIRDVAMLPTPLGKVLERRKLPNGLKIEKVCVPLGVIGMIYESRPNVTSDAAALAIKSGNACVLKCGIEARRTCEAITRALRSGLCKARLPEDAVCLLSDLTRNGASELMQARGYIDLLIPRGGKGLISSCVENATVPTLETGTGICHTYVDKDADLEKALNVIENAKTSRPSVCNALEVVLVHKDVAKTFLPMLKKRLVDERKEAGKIPVEMITDRGACEIIGGTPAKEGDFDTEFLDYKMAIGTVDDVYAATEHIDRHSTHHSDAIITENAATAKVFTKSVDSAAVYVNASTRFTDGGEFGLGCEIGISTQKLHARGPVGIAELTSYKYVIKGNGQVR